MSLMKSFNVNFFRENIKKSKAFLAFFLGIIPILNVLILIFSSTDSVYVPSLEGLSVLNFLFCFIIPIVISICLFGYIFKKKSVDFVNSMPISRKTIFITNTIGGIILILLLNLINSILIFILSITITNFIVPFNMIVDYFLIWSLIYIFIFVVSNIAVSISGNMITSIAITLLILFLVPFICSYIDFKDVYLTSSYAIDGSNINDLTVVANTNYTMPYNFIISSVFSNEIYLINTISIIKMLLLGIVYIVLGYYLFKNRKMEVCETSFKNIYVHNTFKCLTLIPFIVLFYEVLRFSDITTILIMIVMMLAYYFIFDLITRRNIVKIFVNLVFFAIFVIVCCLLLFIVSNILENKKNIIDVDDIKSISLVNYEYDSVYNFSTVMNNIEFSDKDMILDIINNSTGYLDTDSCNNYATVTLNLYNNDRYKLYTCVDSLNLESNDSFIKKFKDINFDDMYAFSIDGVVLDNSVKDELELAFSNVSLDTNIIDSRYTIDAYSYIDHKLVIYKFNYRMSEKLEELYVNTMNKKIINNLDDLQIYSGSCDDLYLIDTDGIVDFIKDNSVVDISKDYVTINIFTNKDTLRYSTNNMDVMRFFDD